MDKLAKSKSLDKKKHGALKNEEDPKQELIRQYWRAEQHRKSHLSAMKDHFDTIGRQESSIKANEGVVHLKKSGLRDNR